ncbi:MAG: antitoxin [Rhodospirillales bacterium 69-11]|nr:DUF2384 domain-containing protein [Rhodospirillales bacterium]MBN8927632.1 DUF2384 domain-containing protein [Rhodospirillales bacterium]OJW18997.1 MAG: antitoxin [Rhodospirillales bacterium 69-11]
MSLSISDDPELARTVSLLGGRRVLRQAVRSRLDAHDLLQAGMPGTALTHLVEHVGVLRTSPQDSLEKAVGISLRTYQRRKEGPDRRLSPEQSGRAWKFAEILARATEVFGTQAEAEAWLDRSALALDGRKPIDLLSTPAGVRSVEELLTRLEYGVYT